MRIRDQDFATGILFILIGVIALWIGWDYPRGTSQRPGTGVLPAILAWCLIGTGCLLMFKTVVATGQQIENWAWRPLLAVAAATIAFGTLVDDLGLVVTMIIALTLCALGTPETRWPEFAIFLAVMVAGGVATFIWLLGMPVPIWPIRVPSFLASILR